MSISGIQKFSLIDYPGKLCCVVFFGGCNFRCPFCHNPVLVFDPESQKAISLEELETFFSSRKGKLDGVVFSGGEPTLSPELPAAARLAKKAGFAVRLDTNSSRPEVVKEMCQEGLVDSLGLDFKGPETLYQTTLRAPEGAWSFLLETVSYALENGIECEIRTTVHQAFLSREDLAGMHAFLASIGVKKWVLQQFHDTETVDESLRKCGTFSDSVLQEIADSFSTPPLVQLRGTRPAERAVPR